MLGNLEPGPTGRDRTSLVMSAENKPGAVHALLTPLARPRQHDAHRVASGAARFALWEYVFFIDVEGHQKDEPVAARSANSSGSRRISRSWGRTRWPN